MKEFIRKIVGKIKEDRAFSEILNGSIWALSAQVLATAFGLVFSIIVARWYGAEKVGIISLMNSFLILTTTVTVLGTNTSILRMIPEHVVKHSFASAVRVYRKTLCIVLSISIVSAVVLYLSSEIVASKIFSKPYLTCYFQIASFFIIFKSIAMLNTQSVRAVRLIRSFALMLTLPQGFNLLILSCLSLAGSSPDIPVYSFLGSFFLTSLTGCCILEYTFKKRADSGSVCNVSVHDILKLSLPMLVGATMSFVISESSVIILGMFREQKEVGYYAIAVKISTLTAFILNAVGAMAGSKFSELYHSNKMDELFHVAKKSAKLIFWTSVPILLITVVFGRYILAMFFGADFVQAYPALVILAFGQLVNSISGATGLFMNMTGRHKEYRNIILMACLANVTLNVLLVPKYGIVGSAIAAMVSLMSWNVAIIVYIKIRLGKTISYFPFVSI